MFSCKGSFLFGVISYVVLRCFSLLRLTLYSAVALFFSVEGDYVLEFMKYATDWNRSSHFAGSGMCSVVMYKTCWYNPLQIYIVYNRNKKLIIVLGSICLFSNISTLFMDIAFRPDGEAITLHCSLFSSSAQLREYLLLPISRDALSCLFLLSLAMLLSL